MTKKSPHAPSAKWTPTDLYAKMQRLYNIAHHNQASMADVIHALGDMMQDEKARTDALSPIQGDPAEALAKARLALKDMEATVRALSAVIAVVSTMPKEVAADCHASYLRATAALAALGSPL
jgi:hypothetical protein